MPVSAASISRVGRLLADETRARMCLALLDGRAWTVTELAHHAEVARSTASEHLTTLVRAGALTEIRQGRHRYLRLTGPHIAETLEALGVLAGEPTQPTSLRAVRERARLRAARTCYDHLAGALGVAVLDGLLSSDLLTRAPGDVALTDAGHRWLKALGGELSLGTVRARPLVRTCLDWTERRDHLGGRAGAVLLTHALRRRWVLRDTALPRALHVTPLGRRAFTTQFGVADEALSALQRTGAV